MELNEFSIKGVVLGTQDLSQLVSDYFLGDFDYIETSISYNNDFRVGKFLKKDAKIISTISSLSQYDIMLQYHLKWLKRDRIDILLVDAKGTWKDEDIMGLYTSEYYGEFGLSGVEKIEDIERVKNLGIKVDWVSMVINPTYFNLELITYLKDSGIKIMSYGVLGGNIMAETNIEVYTLQFLLTFAALYSDLVCISSHCGEEISTNKLVLERFIGLPVTDEVKHVYYLETSRMVKRSPYKRLPVYQYLTKDSMVLKYTGPRNIYVPALSMESDLEKLPEDSELNELEMYIKSGFEKMMLPEDCIPGSGEDLAFWRYSCIALLSIKRGYRKYKYIYEEQGNLFILTRKKKFYLRRRKNLPESYLLAISESTGMPVFKQL